MGASSRSEFHGYQFDLLGGPEIVVEGFEVLGVLRESHSLVEVAGPGDCGSVRGRGGECDQAGGAEVVCGRGLRRARDIEHECGALIGPDRPAVGYRLSYEGRLAPVGLDGRGGPGGSAFEIAGPSNS